MAESRRANETCVEVLSAVCVLADRSLKRWQVGALEEMLQQTEVDISLVVVNDGPAPSSTGRYASSPADDSAVVRSTNSRSLKPADIRLFLRSLRTDGAWAFALAVRKLGWLMGSGCPEWNQSVLVDEVACLNDVETVRCHPRRRGPWNHLPDRVVDSVTERSDVAIRFGFGLLRGRILEELPFGVLSYHPADIRSYRGLGPTEMFLSGDRTGGVTLQQLDETVDGGNVVTIEEVDLSEAYTLEEVRDRIYRTHVPMLAAGLRQLRDPEFVPSPPENLGEYHPLEKLRRFRYVGRLITNNLVGRLRRRWHCRSETSPPSLLREGLEPRSR